MARLLIGIIVLLVASVGLGQQAPGYNPPVNTGPASGSQLIPAVDGFGRRLRDIAYQPNEGERVFFFGLQYANADGSINADGVGKLVGTSVGARSFPLRVGYGFSDELAGFISTSYESRTNKIEPGSGGGESTTREASGLSDVHFGFRWRAVEEEFDVFALQLFYSPKMGDAKADSVVRGGDVFTVGGSWARKYSDRFQGMFEVGYRAVGKRSFEGGSSKTGGDMVVLNVLGQVDVSSRGSVYGGTESVYIMGGTENFGGVLELKLESVLQPGVRVGYRHDLRKRLLLDISFLRQFEAVQKLSAGTTKGDMRGAGNTVLVEFAGEF